jgi:hypothetical protein
MTTSERVAKAKTTARLPAMKENTIDVMIARFSNGSLSTSKRSMESPLLERG